ncbi:MAG: acetoin utilization protein AcuC [Deltaproteobacteria bacterium]|nr:acetoin utilization protein AcuC [Deltaproteobacteria bacterium]
METNQHILFYSDALASFNYGSNHPFKPARAKVFYELLNRYSLIFEENQRIMVPQKLDETLLRLFHTAEYIRLLKLCNAGEFTINMLDFGIGSGDNPVVAGMLDFALDAAGATYEGAMMLAGGRAAVVFNPHGGFHHARSDFAEGFCYVNDIAIAITALIHQGKRVAYCDIDAHHGNGVQEAFYEDRRVLTISLHESGESLYPWGGFVDETGSGDGKGFNVNIPFHAGTDDAIYLAAFDAVVPPLISAFRPDILFIECGGDAHKDDPLAHLNLTSRSYETVLKALKSLCPRIMATGGGGYDVHKTAAVWALTWAALCGIKMTDAFAGLVGGMMYGPEARISSLEDAPFRISGPEEKQCRKEADRVVDYIKKEIFPIHGLGTDLKSVPE